MIPAVVYVDDDASARIAFERAFQSAHRVVAIAASALPSLDTQQAAVVVFEARALKSISEHEFAHLAELHPHTTRIVISQPWQQEDLARLLETACAAWTRTTAQARALSHDLRTPLMSLLADAEHLSALSEQVTSLREVADNMQRAARVVQQLVERLDV